MARPNPGPLTYGSGALPTALRGPARTLMKNMGRNKWRGLDFIALIWDVTLTGKNLLPVREKLDSFL